MAKLCKETMKVYREIFDEAYLLGRSTGMEGIFICPQVAFESYFEQKFADNEQTPICQETFEGQVIAFDSYRANASNSRSM